LLTYRNPASQSNHSFTFGIATSPKDKVGKATLVEVLLNPKLTSDKDMVAVWTAGAFRKAAFAAVVAEVQVQATPKVPVDSADVFEEVDALEEVEARFEAMETAITQVMEPANESAKESTQAVLPSPPSRNPTRVSQTV
jgi:DNA-binding protein YbaB